MPPSDQLVVLESLDPKEASAVLVPLTQHQRYYLSDGDLYVVALSDNTIFRIHAHFLQKHSVWMQTQPHLAGREEDKPLVLCEGISANDFAKVLWVFYDETLERQASGEEWFGILLTAEKMQMPRVQLLASSKLKELTFTTDPIEKIAVQQRYSIRPHWALDAYLEVCTRPKPLTLDEGVRIGLPESIMIAEIREQVARVPVGGILVEKPATLVERVISQDIPPESEPPVPTVLDESETFECGVEGANVVVRTRDKWFRGEGGLVEDSITLYADGLHVSWLLALFYNESLSIELSPTQREAIRALAEQYQMDKVGAFVTRGASNTMDLVEKVRSIHRFNIPLQTPWAAEVYHQLCTRRAPISAEEAARLDPAVWADISARREEVLWKKCEEYERAAMGASIVRDDPSTLFGQYGKLGKKRKIRK
ncbi:hypothetical protein PC9H_011856 [Pleurotus ostreatus]|uniref:BTB domain-containing protein n=1 Tax=Pleurotus ostreatus TaxID=5322 RepID=A0A8H7DNJ2_PLEOS|nr:uncharacterized protein PC9H_011856 [Pleurotus ostreatus]KAF7421333.1 hypothetical protein PC9H_011856 [Pleurotus ostreatus]